MFVFYFSGAKFGKNIRNSLFYISEIMFIYQINYLLDITNYISNINHTKKYL